MCTNNFLVVEKDGSPEQQMDTSEPAQDSSKQDSITNKDSRDSPLLPGEETLLAQEAVPPLPLESEDSSSNFDNNNIGEESNSSSRSSPRKPLAGEVSSLSREASVGVGGDQVSLGRRSSATSSSSSSSSSSSAPATPPTPPPPPAGSGPMEEEDEPMEEGKGGIM